MAICRLANMHGPLCVIWLISNSTAAHSAEGRSSDDDFLVQRSASPGEGLQTKHSSVQLLPFTPPKRDDAWQVFPAEKLTFSTNYWEQRGAGGGDGSKPRSIMHAGIRRGGIEQPLSAGDGLILGGPVPTQTTVLARFHCQCLRFELNFWTLLRQPVTQTSFHPNQASMICPHPTSQSILSSALKHSCMEQLQAAPTSRPSNAHFAH